MTYFGPGHNLVRRGDFGQWASATREDGDSDQRSLGLNSLYINNLSTCLWVKFPIDNPLIRCVSGSYPPRSDDWGSLTAGKTREPPSPAEWGCLRSRRVQKR